MINVPYFDVFPYNNLNYLINGVILILQIVKFPVTGEVLMDLITGLFENPLKGLGLPEYIEILGIFGSIPLLVLSAFLLIVIVFKVNERHKKANDEAQITRPSMEVVNKAYPVHKRIPLNEPMHIQVMVSGLKAANEFLFFLPVPAGAQKKRIKQLLLENGKTWAYDLDFKDFYIRRDRKTGNLMFRNRHNKWRIWKPLWEIQKKGKSDQDWVMQFRLVRPAKQCMSKGLLPWFPS